MPNTVSNPNVMTNNQFYKHLIKALKQVKKSESNPENYETPTQFVTYTECSEVLNTRELHRVGVVKTEAAGNILAVAMYYADDNQGERFVDYFRDTPGNTYESVLATIVSGKLLDTMFSPFSETLEKMVYYPPETPRKKVARQLGISPPSRLIKAKEKSYATFWTFSYFLHEMDIWTIQRALDTLA